MEVIIGKNVKKTRKELGFTQQSFAEKAEISIPYLAQIENGTKGPSLEVIEKLAHALQVEPFELLVPPKTKLTYDKKSVITAFSVELRSELDQKIKELSKKYSSA